MKPSRQLGGRVIESARAAGRRWADGFHGRPRWSLLALAGVAVLAAALYTWGLSRNGMGNSYYAAAVKSGSVSWKAFFFGSLDPGSFITVDKLPASLWVPELFARAFGFSSWSILLPQALAGLASVLILYRLVRRWMGEIAGLLAALALCLTPVAVVMFRFNNPDAFLTLFLLSAAWAFWSALERDSTWKLALAGGFIGLAFTAKMLEAFVVLPAFALVYLVCGRPRLGRRILQVLGGLLALVISSSWWVAIVELWPKASRPYVGGSSNDSALSLIFSRSGGYFGNATGPNFSGSAGWLRMFNEQLGGQISWLIPLAVAGLIAGLWVTRRGPRSDKKRAGFLFWGGWSLLYLVVFSLAKGVLHPYYTVVLAPSLAALVGGGSVALWQVSRTRAWLAWLLPLAVLGTGVWSSVLLSRTSGYAPGLSTAMVVVGAGAAVALVLVLARVVELKALSLAAAALAIVCVLGGPFAYSVSTVSRSVTGSFAAAGPTSAALASAGGPGAGFPVVAALAGDSGPGGAPPAGGGPGAGGPTAAGPSGDAQQVDQGLVNYLVSHRGTATYLVAVEGSEAAVPIILATGQPVIAMGGFNGADPSPTLEEFEAMVASGRVHYVLIGGQGLGGGGGPGGGGPGGSGAQNSVSQWVVANGTVVSSADYGGGASSAVLYYLQ